MTSMVLATVPAAAAPFAPPDSAVILTRVLRSPLADGHEVVARRTYELRFSSDGSGYHVEGRQIEAEVDAPVSLQALAEIERNRTDAALISFRLDSQGRISPEVPKRNTEVLDRAADVAHREVHRRTGTLSEREAAHGLVRQIQSRPALTPWPADLFDPEPRQLTETNSIAPANGPEGHITIETTVTSNGGRAGGHTFRRTVITQIGSQRRLTREEWTLRPAP